MKKIMLAFSIYIIWFALAGSYYVCIIKGLCNDVEDETPSTIFHSDSLLNNENLKDYKKLEEETIKTKEIAIEITDTLYSYPLEIYFLGELITNYNLNFSIKENDSIVFIPRELASFNNAIKNEIAKTENVLVSIYSYYSISEDSTVALGRANFIKEKLKNVGIINEMVQIETEQINIVFDSENKFEGGLELSAELLEAHTTEYNDFTGVDEVASAVENITDISVIEPQSTSLSYDENKLSTISYSKNINGRVESLVENIKTQKKDILSTKVNKTAESKNIEKSLLKSQRKLIKEVYVNEKSLMISASETDKSLKEIKAKTISPKVQIDKKIETVEIPITQPVTTSQASVEKKEIFFKKVKINSEAFKGTKLKNTNDVDFFIKNYKEGQQIYLVGFSNEKVSTFDNYQEGLNLATSIKAYLKKQGISSTNIFVNANRLEQESQLNKGVILQLK